MNTLKKLLALLTVTCLVLSCSKYKEESFYYNTITINFGTIDLNGAFVNPGGDGTYLLYFPFGDVNMMQGPPYISGSGAGLAFFRIVAADGGLPAGTYSSGDGTVQGGYSRSVDVNDISNPDISDRGVVVNVEKDGDNYKITASGESLKSEFSLNYEGPVNTTGYSKYPDDI